MKRRVAVILLLILGTIATAENRAPCGLVIPTTIDARFNGYDTIAFKVMNGTEPMSWAPVRLYRAGRLVLSLSTDKRGVFYLRRIAPSDYTLYVRGWGKATLDVAPLSKVRFVVDEFTLYAPRHNGCHTFVAGIE